MPRGFANRQSLHRHAAGRSPSVCSHYYRAIARLDAALTGVGESELDLEDAEEPAGALVIVSTLDGGEYEIQVRNGSETGKDLANKVKDGMGLPDDARVQLFLGDEPIKPNIQLAKQGIVDGTELELAAIVSTDKALDNASIKEAIKRWMRPATRQSVVDKYGDIGEWNTNQVTDMSELFEYHAEFNEDISQWDTSNVTNMKSMFSDAKSFNQPLEGWDVSKVKDMTSMFAHAYSFNQPLEGWDVSSVTNMARMFYFAWDFNQPLEGWGKKVGNVKNMKSMFSDAKSFNQPLEGWDVSNVEDMAAMFFDARDFNQPLERWGKKVGNVKSMNSMFEYAKFFNQPLEGWNVSSDTSMKDMFDEAKSFKQFPTWYKGPRA